MATRVGEARVVRKTIVIVGEGYSEEAFLKHIRQLYTSSLVDRTLTIRNARGKGALHVVSTTARVARLLPFTHAASLFDANKDWNEELATVARRRRIATLVSTPCLEAELLRMHEDHIERDPATHRMMFEQRFGGAAHDQRVYSTHFSRSFLDAARHRSSMLDALLGILAC